MSVSSDSTTSEEEIPEVPEDVSPVSPIVLDCADENLSKLYNRDGDLSKLIDAYENRNLRHLVLSVGQAGVGKTSLIQRLRPRVEQDRGYFVQGRFDDLDRPEPFSPWIDATEQLLEQIIDRCDEVELATIMKSLNQSMELSEMQALAALIPLLGDLMDLTPPAETAAASHRGRSLGPTGRSNFLVTFGNFLRAVTHPSRPMVWFLDNVHNADSSSLEVIKLLVAGRLPNVLAVIAFRPVSAEHPTSVFLHSLETAGVGLVPILPTAIDKSAILDWLDSYQMGVSEDQRDQISSTIANGAEGNALAIHLCLSIMNWNKEIVKATGGTPLQAGGDITSLFRLLFQMLPSNSRQVCLTASCMGTMIDVPHLAEILTCDIPTALAEAERHEIVKFHYYPNPPRTQTAEGKNPAEEETLPPVQRKKPGELHDLQLGYYEFANTTYRELLYSILSPEDRMLQHTAIGNVFRRDVGRVGIFRVVVHMALAVERLAPKAKELLVGYCVEAGRRASQWSEFVLAAKYLQMGISLLVDCSPKWWKTHTPLIVDLYCDTAEVALSLGKYQEMEALLGEATNQGNEPSYRLRATKIQMQANMVQSQPAEAIATGLRGLQKNHEQIKKNATLESELRLVRKLLEGDGKFDEESILNRHVMTDAKSLGAMEIMNLLISPALLIQSDLVPVVASRMVRLSYKQGIASSTPLALCLLGVTLSLEREVELGVWCSETGLALVEMMNDKSVKGRVMTIHWGLLSRFAKPWRICQEPLKLAYRTCIKGGDSEFAMICPVISTLNMFAAGGALPPIAEAMKSVYQLLQRKNQQPLQRMLRPFYQLVLNLMGVSPEVNPSVLTGTIMREEDDLRYIQEHPNDSKTIECCLLWCQSVIAFYLHKFGKARDLIEKCNDLYHKCPLVILGSIQIPLEFLNAMTAVRLMWRIRTKTSLDGGKQSAADKKRQATLEATAENSLQVLNQLAGHSPENVQHKVLMVQGELHALEGNVDSAMDCFQRAIDLAEEHGSIADKALFGEQAGLTLRLCANEDDALNHLEDCCTSYRAWGALIKVNHLKGTVIPEANYDLED